MVSLQKLTSLEGEQTNKRTLKVLGCSPETYCSSYSAEHNLVAKVFNQALSCSHFGSLDSHLRIIPVKFHKIGPGGLGEVI